MPELVAIAYEEEVTADRAVEELRRCRDEIPIDPEASAVLLCARDGRCELTISSEADTTVHWGELWGALLEALLSGAGPVAIERYFRNELLARLWPGTSMLLLVAPADDKGRILRALSHFGGQALGYRLADDLLGRWSVRDPGPGR